MNTNSRINKLYISSEVKFYTISNLVDMLGWSEMTVQKLFNDPKFPAANYGDVKLSKLMLL